jgi:hypothetical protein
MRTQGEMAVATTALNRHKNADDRAEKRLPVSLTAVIINDDTQPETIQILNIARLGFLAKSQRPRETGEAIVMHIDQLGQCEAHIIWSSAGQFGGRFIHPVDTTAYPDLIIATAASRSNR